MLSDAVQALAGLNRVRAGLVSQTTAISNRMGGQLRSALGWRSDLSKAESEKIAARARQIVAAVKADAEGAENTAGAWRGAVMAALVAVALFEKERKKIERQMERLAPQLPAYAWVRSVNGFGDLTFAVIVAHCHGAQDRGLSDFPSHSKMWKRLGLGFAGAGENETAVRQMHKWRRSAIYVGIYDAMLRQQWCSEVGAYRKALEDDPAAAAEIQRRDIDLKQVKKIEELRELAEPFGIVAEAHAIGPYGEVYGRAKARYTLRVAATADLPAELGGKKNPDKWTPAHADMAARRLMAKRVLRDLWRVWHAEVAAQEIGAPEADWLMPQGHATVAAGAPNQTEAENAVRRLPKGPTAYADSASALIGADTAMSVMTGVRAKPTRRAKAKEFLPQGHCTGADALLTPSPSVAASPGVPQGHRNPAAALGDHRNPQGDAG
jgi:hypothetical protein